MTDDLIRRQAAIDAADRTDYTGLAVEDVKKVTDEVVKELKQLSSAQPEIIRCEDCKHSHADELFTMLWCHGDIVDKNHFCSKAERRTDE